MANREKLSRLFQFVVHLFFNNGKLSFTAAMRYSVTADNTRSSFLPCLLLLIRRMSALRPCLTIIKMYNRRDNSRDFIANILLGQSTLVRFRNFPGRITERPN